MIAYVCGEVADVLESSVIVDVGGVGYEVGTTARVCGQLTGVKEKVKLHTWLQVKEDGLQLFGFLRKDDLRVFRLLLGVSGIWWAVPIGWFLADAVGLAYYWRKRKGLFVRTAG